MAVQNSDTFNRVGGTLGGNWSDLNGGGAPAFTTDLRTDGNYAFFGTGGQIHGALLSSTNQTNALVQCWIRIPAAGNNAGIIFRAVDINNFYMLRVGPGATGIQFARRVGDNVSAPYTSFGPTAAGPGAGVWTRFSIRMVGTEMVAYFNGNHLIANSGPNLVTTDSNHASGNCGIISTGNTAGGIGVTNWNDFIARDGQPDVIYVDTAFNGGALGEGMGTEDRPDLGIDWALNNCGCEQGSKIKIQSIATITNALAPIGGNDGQYAINHRGRWSPAGVTFATYDDANGRMTSTGTPALTIEGPNGDPRVILQETRNTEFFSTAGTAAFKSGGLCVRGIRYRGTGGTSSALTTASGANNAGDSSFSIEKCQLDAETATSGVFRVVSNGRAARIQVVYNYFRALVAGVIGLVRVDTANSVDSLFVRMNVFDAQTAAMANSASTGAVSVLTGGCAVGDNWDIDHNTFVEIRSAGTTDAALNFASATDLDGTAEFQNNIVAGQANPDETGGGFRVAAGVVSGTTNAHHNGYFNVLTPRSSSVTDGGDEIDSSDPIFVNPNAAFKWQHTAGSGLLGEGTFAPIDLDGDYRPLSPLYLDSADDSNPLLGVLDRGALQNFIEPSPGGGGGSDVVPISEQAYCVTVIYDRGGPNELDLSSRLETTRPLRQEKDVLLRQYKASDTELTFSDVDGIFIEINPGSFLRGTDGRSNWFGKPVDVFVTQGADTLVRYRGFVINVQANRGTGTLVLGNRFQRIFDRIAFANDMGRVVSTTGAPGMGRSSFGDLAAPATGAWLTRVLLGGQTPFDPGRAPFVETLTFSFLSGGATAQFSATGSLTGPKGFGSVDQFFTADDGSFTINPILWENEGTIVQGQTCTLKLVWRPTAGVSIIDALLEFLTNDHACDIDLADIDTASFDSFRGTIADQSVALVSPPVSVPMSRLVVDEPTPLLQYLLEFALHVGCSLIERADGRFALNSLVPRAYDLGELPVLCKSDDLMAIGIDHLDVYNVYNFEYNRSEMLDRYQSGGRWPLTFNESFDKYGRLLPAPNAMSFRGYDEGARAWIEIIAQSIFIRYQDPARIYASKAKIQRMSTDLDTVFRIDSEGPTFRGPIVEPFVIQRNATGDLTVDQELLEVRILTEECGDFLWYDNPRMGYDDECWGYF